eukprot:6172455-Pleurochrysis_carterae.AAC.1
MRTCACACVQAYGQYISGSIDEETRSDIIHNACPGALGRLCMRAFTLACMHRPAQAQTGTHRHTQAYEHRRTDMGAHNERSRRPCCMQAHAGTHSCRRSCAQTHTCCCSCRCDAACFSELFLVDLRATYLLENAVCLSGVGERGFERGVVFLKLWRVSFAPRHIAVGMSC